MKNRIASRASSSEMGSPAVTELGGANDRSVSVCRWDMGSAANVTELDKLLQKLRALSAADVLSAWTSMAGSLPADQAELVLREVHRLTGVSVRALGSGLRQARSNAAMGARGAQREQRLAGRMAILYEAENRFRQAEELDAAIAAAADPGCYLEFGGSLCQVTYRQLPYTQSLEGTKSEPPAVPQITPLDEVAMLERVEKIAVFCRPGKGGHPIPIAVPDAVLNILLKKQAHAAPVVRGLVTHPIVLPDTGDILADDGLHEATGLFLAGASVTGTRPYQQDEAKHAVRRLRSELLEGFEFAEQRDADAALAGLFTGLMRRVLDVAPGLAILASTQSSGKTTLARRIHLILTGHDLAVSAFPQDEAEMQKRLLALLLRSPAMVCFDNLLDGMTFRSGALAAAMTGPVFTQRVLGSNRDVDCPTNVLFVITGNNLQLGADEVTRWLVARLAPSKARPEQRQFRHVDVVRHALSIRQAVLRDTVGIVAGYLTSGDAISNATRFPRWHLVVRQPLIWAGASDLAEIFRANEESSEDLLAHRAMICAVEKIFGTKEFFASELADVARTSCWPGRPFPATEEPDSNEEMRQQLVSALLSLRAKEAGNERSVGRVLQAKVDRPVEIEETPHRVLIFRSRVVHGRKKYRVESLG